MSSGFARAGLPAPYRVLFPLGALFGLIGAGLWPLAATGAAPYPGPLHAVLMIQGFEQSFVLGFFLTAMPAFTHGEKCRPVELAVALVGMLGFGALALTGWPRMAEVEFSITVFLLLFAAAMRIARSRTAPPEEFVFVILGLGLGLAGGVILSLSAAGGFGGPWPQLGLRLISRGMVLSLVLGFGALLVPTFMRMRDPLAIPGIARPGERAPRRRLYATIAVLLLAAFAAEWRHQLALGAWLRAAAAAGMVLWVWKLYRLPGRRDPLSFALWSSGWFVLAGLVAEAALPRWATGAFHLALIGGFGLLTLGIATRVVVSHGGLPLERERGVLTPWTITWLLLAVVLREAAEIAPAQRMALLGLSGGAWMAGWLLWSWRSVPIAFSPRPERIDVPVAPRPREAR